MCPPGRSSAEQAPWGGFCGRVGAGGAFCGGIGGFGTVRAEEPNAQSDHQKCQQQEQDQEFFLFHGGSLRFVLLPFVGDVNIIDSANSNVKR